MGIECGVCDHPPHEARFELWRSSCCCCSWLPLAVSQRFLRVWFADCAGIHCACAVDGSACVCSGVLQAGLSARQTWHWLAAHLAVRPHRLVQHGGF
jgi:hypothetical protein